MRSLVATVAIQAGLTALLTRLNSSPLAHRLAKGAFWALLGATISRSLSLLATIFVARILGSVEFGEVGILRSTVEMFGIFAGFGLGLTATKYVSEFRRSDPVRAGNIIALTNLAALMTASIAALLLFALAPWLATHTLHAPHLASLLRVACLVLLLTTLTGAQNGALAGFEAFQTIAWVNLGVGLLSFPMVIGGAYLAGTLGVLWGLVLTLCLNWMLNKIALRAETSRNRVPILRGNALSERSLLWNFSVPAALSSAVVGPVNWFCATLLVAYPNGYTELGVFYAANHWRTAILFIPTALTSIAVPVLSNLVGESQNERYRRVLFLTAATNLMATMAVAIPVAVFSPKIMAIYGPGFAGQGAVLVWLALSSVLMTVGTVAGNVVISRDRMWVGFGLNAIWAVCILLSTSLLAKDGANGLALAVFASYCLHGVTTTIYAASVLRARPSHSPHVGGTKKNEPLFRPN
jgi:O-antigen/teichoic acid export membrane protein